MKHLIVTQKIASSSLAAVAKVSELILEFLTILVIISMGLNSDSVKAWRRRTKLRIVEAMGGECQCCGYNKCVNSLDLHHINPEEKNFSFGKMRANPKSWKKVVEELKKCVLLCRNCHGEIHAGVTELPKVFKRFDPSFTKYKVSKTTSCPICDKPKEAHNKTCSYACAAKLSRKVNWEEFDLHKLYVVDKISMRKIASIVGVSDSAVLKRLRKLGIRS